MANPKTIKVSILDTQYQVSCRPDEVEALKRAAAYLDERMREMKKRAKLTSLDRLAVTAALNITNDLLTNLDQQGTQIAGLADKVDIALNRLKDGAE
ncbi:MAG: cell division protein ZapA, partial [Pseudomonadales bacterium]